MKFKWLLIVIVILIVCLFCIGLVSCRQDTSEEQNGTDDDIQSLTEDEYNIEIAAIALELIITVNGLDQMLANPETDDHDWIMAINLVMEDINTLCDEAYQIKPPDSMTDIHIVNLEAIANLDNAVGLLADGIDENDINLLNRAGTEMWLAVEVLVDVIEVSE